jgi:hypothetical protein
MAKRGQRTDSDSFVRECEKAEASIDSASLSKGFQKGLDEYCTPEFAYVLGKRGEFLVNDMCSGSAERMMKPKHEEGVREYCQPANGVQAGAQGKKYNQICPKDLETAFLPQFNQGRKRYLSSLATQKEAEIQDIDKEIGDLNRKKHEMLFEIEQLMRQKTVVQTTTVNRTGSSVQVEQVSAERNSRNIESEIQSIRWNMNRVDQEIESKRKRQQALRQEIRDARTEEGTL